TCPTDASGHPQAGSCAIGKCVQCTAGASGWVCGTCCTQGKDFVFCGDEWLYSCCNHQCVDFVNDTNCGACGVDCTCGGTDPDRKWPRTTLAAPNCTDAPGGDPLPCTFATCGGTYSPASGHCASNSIQLSAAQKVCASGTQCPTLAPCQCANP